MNDRKSFGQKKSVRALMVGLFVWGAISFLPPSFFQPLRIVLAPVAEPFQGFFSWVAFEVGEMTHVISSISDLKSENENLRRDKLALEEQVSLLREANEENRLLREELHLPPEGIKKTLSAEVIGRDTNGLAMSFLVNRGSTDDLKEGMPVVVGGGNLVGRISRVFLSSSEVRLLSHPESTVAVRVSGSSVQGIVRGDHGLGLLLDMALAGETLQSGQPIISSGLGDSFPKGLLIGHIKEVRPSSDRLFQQATLVTPVSSSDIRFVSILFAESI